MLIMKKCISKVVAAVLAVATITGGIILYQFHCVGTEEFSAEKVGIIDDCLNNLSFDNTVIYNSDLFQSKNSHGQELIRYLCLRGYTGEIYYYTAQDKNGKINSNAILDGLNWMKENNITNVNISLSSKKKNQELEEWIREHGEMQIFSSYNNEDNSLDYPAMYEQVVASGSSQNIEYKENDRKYITNRILLWNQGVHYFEGNSFLSLETLLGKQVEK